MPEQNIPPYMQGPYQQQQPQKEESRMPQGLKVVLTICAFLIVAIAAVIICLKIGLIITDVIMDQVNDISQEMDRLHRKASRGDWGALVGLLFIVGILAWIARMLWGAIAPRKEDDDDY